MSDESRHEQYQNVLSDPERLAVLDELELVDTPAEEIFDRLTRLASKLLPTPVALVSIVDNKRQFFKSFIGLEDPWASMRETPLSHSFCQHVVVSGKALIVENAHEHPLVQDNLAIEDLGVVSYLGMPLTTTNGMTLGSFCVIDSETRQWTEHDIETVRELARSVMTEIELRSEVSKLQATQNALHASEERYRSVVTAMAEGIVLQNQNGEIVTCNTSAERILGLTLDQMRGRTSTDPRWRAIHEDGSVFPGEEHPIVETLKTGEAQHNVIMGVHKPDDSVTWIAINTEALWYEDEDSPYAAIASFSDITQLKNTLAERDELIANLDTFAHTVAHDLKNPISHLSGYAHVLSNFEDLDSETTKEYLGNVEKNAIRMADIIDALLLLASTQQLQDVHVETVAMQAIIANVQERLRLTIEEHSATISVANEFPAAVGYAPWVEEVLINYVSNALKYGGEPPSVALGAETSQEGMVRFWVRDNGMGLTPDEQAQLFVPFKRVTQAKIDGHGLGLSIVRQIVERLGGSVGVSSELGQGSEFSFTLPTA